MTDIEVKQMVYAKDCAAEVSPDEALKIVKNSKFNFARIR